MFIKNRERVIQALETKIGLRPCPLCGKHAGFMPNLEEHQVIGFDRTTNGLNIGPDGEHIYIPCIPIICKNCGNVQMLALQVLMDDSDYLDSSLC